MNRPKCLMPLVLLLFSLDANAANKVLVLPVVPLSSDQIGTKAAKEMTAAIIEELGLNPEMKAVRGSFPKGSRYKKETGRKPVKSDAEYRRGLRKLSEGEKHSKRLRFPKAISALSTAIKLLNRNIEFVSDYDRFIEGHMLLAIAYFRRGKESKGVDLLEKVLRYRPTMALDANQYPPIFVRIFERTRDRMLAREPGEISVKSDAPQAEVFLNGVLMGNTPVEIDQVFPGKNHLVVKTQKGASWGRLVNVRSGQQREVKAAFGKGSSKNKLSAKEVVAQNRFDLDTRRFLLQEGKKKRTNYVLSLGVGSGLGVFVVSGFVGDVRTGKWIRLSPLSPDVDMLSVSIEANSLAQNLSSAFRDFSPVVENQTVAYIESKEMVGVVGQANTEVTYESFFDASELKRSRVLAKKPTGRAPLVAAQNTSVPPRNESSSVSREANTTRTPIGVAAQRGAAFPSRADRANQAPAPSPKRVAPLSRSNAGPQRSSGRAGRGPLVRTGNENLGGNEILRDSDRAATRVGASAVPMTQDLSLDGRYDTPVTEEWWFWSSIGVTSLALAGAATWYFFLQDGEPTSVTVNAEW